MDFLEFPDVMQEVSGALVHGRLKLTNNAIAFKNNKNGKVEQILATDVDLVNWMRMAGDYGLRIFLNNGQLHRFAGFKEADQEKLAKFFNHTSGKSLQEKQLSLKGWNWGTVRFTGSVLSFDIDRTTAFEIPLTNVSHCTAAKNEVTLQFHQNDDAAVSLMELRFHVPSDVAGEIEAFRDNVMSKANIIQATGDAIATFKEVQCLTPRGRYDIKLFPSFIQLHGKTFDYKIPMSTVLRLFLLPHKDQRQMFFVVSLDPPIKQGQTRYHFLILQFNNEDETVLEVGLSDKEIQEKYEGKLQKEMTGPTYEVMSKMMKVLIQRKITVPGSFVGNSQTPAVSCSYKAAAGFMYPLERGFIYVHKPPIHIRFEEVASVNFARSGGSTRSFDFEVELRSGVVHTFSSIEKEEYGKLFDFITNKKLRVKNRGPMTKKEKALNYAEDELVDSDVEDEPDVYLARVKAEAKERDDDGGDDSDDESDESFNPGDNSGSEVAEEFDSNASSSSSSDEEGGSPNKEKDAKKHREKSRKAKTVPETRKPRKKKKERDENKPKRPQSAYFLWLNENRERLKKEHPGISITDLSKKAGEEWKDVKNRTKWEKLAEEGKKEYEKALAEYKANVNESSATPSTPVKKEKRSSGSSKNQKSPQKSPGAYKSKEYISSSDGSSSDNDSDAKKSKAKGKAKQEKSVKVKKEEEPKSSEEEEKKEEEEEEDDKVKEEEESAGSTPATSEDDD